MKYQLPKFASISGHNYSSDVMGLFTENVLANKGSATGLVQPVKASIYILRLNMPGIIKNIIKKNVMTYISSETLVVQTINYYK